MKMGTPKLVIQGNHIYRNMVTLVLFPCKLGLRLGIRLGIRRLGLGLRLGIGLRLGLGLGIRLGLELGIRLGLGLGIGIRLGLGLGTRLGLRLRPLPSPYYTGHLISQGDTQSGVKSGTWDTQFYGRRKFS